MVKSRLNKGSLDPYSLNLYIYPMQWLNLIRWQNLTVMIYMMLMAGWVLHIHFSLNYIFLICCVIVTAAAGNIWNDLNDQLADNINKPEKVYIEVFIPKIHALLAFWILNGVAVFFSLILFFQSYPFVLVITLIAQILLFLYSLLFKRVVILGNLIISILAWMSFLLLILYAKDAGGINQKWVMHLGLLAFFTTWIREAVKDMQDAPGDREANYRTLSVVWPLIYSKIYIFLLIALYIGYVMYFALSNNWLTFFPARLIPYLLVLLIPPVLIVWRIIVAENPYDYKKTGNMIKIWMVIGISSTMLWKGIVF